MSITKIRAKLIKANQTIVIVYKNDALKRVEFGKIGKVELDKIGMVIPHRKSDLPVFFEKWKDKVEYTLEEKEPTLHQEMVDAWHSFYEDFIGFKPKFNGADGKALKDIREHLTNIGGNPKEALILWKGILGMWKDLEKFHQKNTDLKYINSRLNAILSEIKTRNTNQTYKTTTDGRYDL
ncbi:MAG: hypothetical protein ACPGSD_07860 [Flavobacteriales bacterium]